MQRNVQWVQTKLICITKHSSTSALLQGLQWVMFDSVWLRFSHIIHSQQWVCCMWVSSEVLLWHHTEQRFSALKTLLKDRCWAFFKHWLSFLTISFSHLFLKMLIIMSSSVNNDSDLFSLHWAWRLTDLSVRDRSSLLFTAVSLSVQMLMIYIHYISIHTRYDRKYNTVKNV